MKECVNCKYSEGVGSDVWCGHKPKGKETYMPTKDTDCPYYKKIMTNEEQIIKNLKEELNDVGSSLEEQIQRLQKENEQLKQQLNDITLDWTQNFVDFDRDKLYVKDNNTEITLRDGELFIQVFIPQNNEYFQFHYIVTGRRLIRGCDTCKEGIE